MTTVPGRRVGGAPRTARWVAIVLAIVTAAVYAQVRDHAFINYDDPGYVTANRIVQGGLSWSNVVWAFTTGDMANWHPLTWLAHMLDCQLFGVSTGAHHLVNVGWHVVNTGLVLVIFTRLTARVWPSAVVAALFALHPLHVESVAWVSERKDVLSTCFWLLTMWGYARYVDAPRAGRYALVLLPFALGLMTKPMLVTLPFVLLLLDYWPLGRIRLVGWRPVIPATVVVEKIPLFVLVGVSSVVTFLVQHRGRTVADLGLLPPGERVANALVSYAAYVRKTLWPSNLAIPYPLHVPIPATEVLVASAVLFATTAVVLAAMRARPYLLVGWLWFLGTLVPVIGLVQVGEQAMADRYTYVPLLGLFVMAAWGAADVVARAPRARAAVSAVAGVALVAYTALTWAQIRHWRDGVTLFEHTLAVTADNEDAHFGLAIILIERGQGEQAVPHLEAALRINPQYAEAHVQLGMLLSMAGRSADAIPHYEAALAIDPYLSDAHEFLGIELFNQGTFTEAMSHLTAALRVSPGLPRTHYTMGRVLFAQGKTAEATAHLEETLRLDPTFWRAHYELGQLWTAQARTAEAIKAFREALRLQPDAADVANELAWTLATHDSPDVRDADEAVRLAERACVLTGRQDAAKLDTLAAAYAEAGRFPEAVRTAEEAVAQARKDGQDPLAGAIEGNLQLLRAGHPVREHEPATP